jgi:hypothetical protein
LLDLLVEAPDPAHDLAVAASHETKVLTPVPIHHSSPVELIAAISVSIFYCFPMKMADIIAPFLFATGTRGPCITWRYRVFIYPGVVVFWFLPRRVCLPSSCCYLQQLLQYHVHRGRFCVALLFNYVYLWFLGLSFLNSLPWYTR